MTTSRIHAILLVFFALLPPFARAEAPADHLAPGSGFIHATVTWPSGEAKTGYLRWGEEEAFWDDLFHCGYRDLVWSDHADLDQLRKERRDHYFATHGLMERLAYAIHEDKDDPLGWRMFVSRFGDLRSIEIHDGRDDFAVTADGSRHQIGGFDRDAGTRLKLYVGQEEPESIRWNDLSEIAFSQAPAGSVPYAERLYGRLQTTQSAYEGFIQWDRSECTTTDVLDGKEDDRDVELVMGEIRTITRARDNAADVLMKDGSEHHLAGSNDVNSSNRGIMVEVAGLGRVTVPWRRFVSLTFGEGQGSGVARTAYANADPLFGQVTDTDGRHLSGRLVFDLDEAWRWDLFNGTDSDGLDYDIPFCKLARIEPGPQASCRVTLRGGQVLQLGENQDTGEENAGVLVFDTEGEAPEHVSWGRIQRIDFRP
jgi:hypothetical protein